MYSVRGLWVADGGGNYVVGVQHWGWVLCSVGFLDTKC